MFGEQVREKLSDNQTLNYFRVIRWLTRVGRRLRGRPRFFPKRLSAVPRPCAANMRFLTSLPRAAGVAALGATTGLMLPRRLPLAAPAEPHEAAKPLKGPPARELSAEDPHLWLEEIEGEAALEWCKAQNARAVGTVGDPHASESYRKILAIADSKDKIPHVGRIGGRTGDEEVRRKENAFSGRSR